jgi:putative transposase
MYKLSKTNNAVFSLRYHLIAVVKYRQKVFLSEALISDLKQMVESISEDFEVEVIEQECGEDHLHLLFSSKTDTPSYQIHQYFEGAYFSSSSRETQRLFER